MTTPLTKEEQKEQDKFEAEVVEDMASAQTISDKLFGDRSNLFAVHEIYYWLQETDDEADFAADLKRTIEYAKTAHRTEAPTPEQVFGLFDILFDDGEE